MKGKFIVFEGGEGSGKTIQVEKLAENLKKEGKEVFVTYEPGGTELGEELRTILMYREEKIHPMAEVLLFCADRSHHIKTVIKPALKSGKIVICDRFSVSTFVYQYYGEKSLEKIKVIDAYSRDGIWPDLIIYLDVPPEIGLRRVRDDKKRRGLTKFDKKTIQFHKSIRKRFLRLFKQNDWNWEKIDATLSIQEVEQQIWKIVKNL